MQSLDKKMLNEGVWKLGSYEVRKNEKEEKGDN